MTKLREEDLVCAEVLVDKSHSVREVSRRLGVAESTLRYRLKRRSQGTMDGRSLQGEACAKHEEAIRAWLKEQEDRAGRPDSVRSLYETLGLRARLHGQLSVRTALRATAASGAQAASDSTGRGAARQPGSGRLGGASGLRVRIGRLDTAQRLQLEPELFAHVVRSMATRSGSVVVAGCPQRGLSSDRRRAVVGALRQLQDGGGLQRGTVGCSESGLPLLRRTAGLCARRLPPPHAHRQGQDGTAGPGCACRADSVQRPLRYAGGSAAHFRRADRRAGSTVEVSAHRPVDRRIVAAGAVAPVSAADDLADAVRRRGSSARCHGTAWYGSRVVSMGCPSLVWIAPYASGAVPGRWRSTPRESTSRRIRGIRPVVDSSIRMVTRGRATDRVEAPTRLGKIGQRIVLPRSWDWEAPRRGVDRYALLVEQAGRQA